MEDAIPNPVPGSAGWSVAGVLTDLSGALLTTLPGEAGLAGTIELDKPLGHAANDASYDGRTGRSK